MSQAEQRREDNLAIVRKLGEQAKVGRRNSHTIQVDYTSMSGEVYAGDLEVHRPDVRDNLKIGALRARYLQEYFLDDKGNPIDINPMLIDADTRFMAEALATLKVVVDKRPEWLLKPEAIEDPDVISHIYGLYYQWVTSFRRPSNVEPQGDSQATE